MCLRAEELGSESSSSDSFCTPFAVHTGRGAYSDPFTSRPELGRVILSTTYSIIPLFFIWRSNGLGPHIQ
jgi:hypothetical protein